MIELVKEPERGQSSGIIAGSSILPIRSHLDFARLTNSSALQV